MSRWHTQPSEEERANQLLLLTGGPRRFAPRSPGEEHVVVPQTSSVSTYGCGASKGVAQWS